MIEVALPVTVTQRNIIQVHANKKQPACKHVVQQLKLMRQLELTGTGRGLEADRLKVNRRKPDE